MEAVPIIYLTLRYYFTSDGLGKNLARYETQWT